VRSIVFFLVVSVAAILIAGCDPGIAYKPANWKHLRNFEFTNKYDGFDLELRGFQGFIGSKGDITEGEILNTENQIQKIYVERAVLKANNIEYVGAPNYRNENTIHDTQPNGRQHFSILWNFDKSLYEVLKEPVELSLVIKRGSSSQEILIPMVENKQ
jgi:hypothetical protein